MGAKHRILVGTYCLLVRLISSLGLVSIQFIFIHKFSNLQTLLTFRLHPMHMAPFSFNMRRRYIWDRRYLLVV